MCEDGRSLLQILDRTVTPMGSTTDASLAALPLTDVKAINARLDVVEGFMRYPDERTLLKEGLEQAGDMERVISKVAVWQSVAS